MIGWLIVIAYVVGYLVAWRAIWRTFEEGPGVDNSDPVDVTLTGLAASLAALFWPIGFFVYGLKYLLIDLPTKGE